MWTGGFPLYLDHARGNRITDVDGHTYVDFALGDTGAMAGHSPAPTVAAVHAADGRARRHHDDAADRGRAVGGRRADPPLRAAAVELHALGDRRQPLGDPPGPAGHRPAQDPGLRLLLPRLGRRDVRAARSRRQGESRPGQRRSPGRRSTSPPAPSTWNDLDVRRARAGPRRRRRDPHRAGADQHRHRAARARVHGGPARAGDEVRHAADDRRDPHVLGGLPAARPGPGRCEPDIFVIGKSIGGGIPSGAYGISRRGRRRDHPAHGGRATPTSSTSAAWAAPWPATPSRPPRCGRPSARCSPRRRSRT